MKHKIAIVLILLSLMLFNACNSGIKEFKENKIACKAPYGTIAIDDTLFLDSVKISNMDYSEYLFWTGRIYGKNSTTYKKTLPDTLVWRDSLLDNEPYVEYYLRHPSYKDYPVVGVSYQQALNFSKWRSDRVFQKSLVDKKLIDWNDLEDSTNYFTIEKYFKGEYFNIKPDFNILYPDYTLSTLDEWNYIISKTDIFNKNIIPIEKKKTDIDEFEHEIVTSESEDKGVNHKKEKVVQVNIDPQSKFIFHLYDNVSEISMDKGIALGGNWNLRNQGINGNVVSTFGKPNAWTGFRNVCRWKKYKDQ